MKIIGTGSYLPSAVLTNDDLSKIVDTSDEWIQARTGIQLRHVARDEKNASLAVKAALSAIVDAGIKAAEIDLVIVATSTPDSFIPGVSHALIKELNISQAMTFDINAACTGFVYALDVASSLMRSHSYKYALVIGTEVMSKLVDWTDRNTCVLFGDGAGAVVVQNCEENLFLAQCRSLPDEDDVLKSGDIATNNPLVKADPQPIFLKMKGQEVFKFAVSRVCESVKEIISEAEIPLEEVDYFILHQANSRIMDFVAKRLKIEPEKLYSTIAHTGNTSAASIPIVIDEMNRKKLLKKGMRLVFTGFGAGLTYGSVVIEW